MAKHEKVSVPQKKENISDNHSSDIPLRRGTHPSTIIQKVRAYPESLTHADAMILQRSIGNRAVCQLMKEIGFMNANNKSVQRKALSENEEKVLPEKFDIIQKVEKEHPQLKKENNTGLPDNLKAGVESLSGLSMDDVRVHYNSDKPTGLQALAYTQGTDIYVTPGQEKHLPHEAWHVVQQKQGRVRPTTQLKCVQVNDDVGLEREADTMGIKALKLDLSNPIQSQVIQKSSGVPVVQRVYFASVDEMWRQVAPDIPEIMSIISQNTELSRAYNDIKAKIGSMDFDYQAGCQPEAQILPNDKGVIRYGLRAEMQGDYRNKDRYIGAIIHEMMHITAALQYNTNARPGKMGRMANMHLPVPVGEVPDDEWGLADNQFKDTGNGVESQVKIMYNNWENLRAEVNLEKENGTLTEKQADVLNGMGGRIDYAQSIFPMAHYDTVLVDIIYYLVGQGLEGSRTCKYATKMLREANNRRAAGVGTVAALNRDPIPRHEGCTIL